MAREAKTPPMNSLPPVTSPRTEYLRNYLLACVRDNVIGVSDLSSISLLGKLQATLAKDVRSVLVDLGTQMVSAVACTLFNKLRT